MKSIKGRELHQKALATQEGGDLLEALRLEDEAMLAYQSDGDQSGFAEIQAMRTLTLNILGDQTGDIVYYILAMHAALASLELAEKAGATEQIGLAHGAVGRTMYRAERYGEAAEHFDKAIEGQSRKSVIADFRNHAATSRLANGDLGQEKIALTALTELDAAGDESEHELKVWKSGGLMRLAIGMKKNGKIEEAKKYLAEVERMVAGDDDLKVRQGQVEKLAKQING